MTDQIAVSGLRLFAKHGVFKPEQDNGQLFIVDVVAWLDIGPAARDDAYAKTVCLNDICHAVNTVSENGPYKLIETFAEKIADFLLETFSRLAEVNVTVHKPDAPVDFEIDRTKVNISRRRMHEIALGLGSNMGDCVANLKAAIMHLDVSSDIEITKVSSIYETKAETPNTQANYLNMCAIGYTYLTPRALLSHLKLLELKLGRVTTIPLAPRVIDIDILIYGDLTQKSRSLTIPHPRMLGRAFVLAPLAELKPNWAVLGGSVQPHLDRLSGKEKGLNIVNISEF